MNTSVNITELLFYDIGMFVILIDESANMFCNNESI